MGDLEKDSAASERRRMTKLRGRLVTYERPHGPGVESHPVKNSLGERLREARERAGMTIDMLATQSGVSKSMLSRVERDERSLAVDTASAVCDALDLSLDELAGRTAKRVPRGSDRGARLPKPTLTRLRRLAAELQAGLAALN